MSGGIMDNTTGTDAIDTESALILAGIVRGAQSYWMDDEGEAVSIELDSTELPGGFIGGSEPEFRPEEIVCPVTWLTRHKDLTECPHCFGECSTYETKEVAA